MSVLSDDDYWLQRLPENHRGLKILTLPVALEIAREFRSGWYVAPHATRWTAGKAGTPPLRFHILDDSGEPLCFETTKAAQRYLRERLGVKGRVQPLEAAPAALWPTGARKERPYAHA